ncbi:MAG: hypothetical protein AVDCRST_MAG77-959, partial [uncultured Chloroflexi bacterium]
CAGWRNKCAAAAMPFMPGAWRSRSWSGTHDARSPGNRMKATTGDAPTCAITCAGAARRACRTKRLRRRS